MAPDAGRPVKDRFQPVAHTELDGKGMALTCLDGHTPKSSRVGVATNPYPKRLDGCTSVASPLGPSAASPSSSVWATCRGPPPRRGVQPPQPLDLLLLSHGKAALPAGTDSEARLASRDCKGKKVEPFPTQRRTPMLEARPLLLSLLGRPLRPRTDPRHPTLATPPGSPLHSDIG